MEFLNARRIFRQDPGKYVLRKVIQNTWMRKG